MSSERSDDQSGDSHEKLAMMGGPRAVTAEAVENWPPPNDVIKQAVCDMIDRGVYSEAGSGTTGELESRFADYIGSRYCLAQNNGTSTLWSAYYALGIGPGDEVLHPAYTWICSIAPAVHLGAVPVFCEVSDKNLTIDPADMERRITPRTKAISIVHIHGNICDMDAIMEIANRHGIPVVEDCSHVHGGEWDGRKVGSIGAIGCFSMQGAPPEGKPLPAGEGGLLVTDRRDLYERILFLGHLNRRGLSDELTDPKLSRLAPTASGMKFRPHPWAMAAALAMLDSLDERNAKRRAFRDGLYERLAGVPGIDPLIDHEKAVPAGFFGGMQLIYKPDELGDLPLEDYLFALNAEGVPVNLRPPYDLTHRLPLFAEGHNLYGTGGPLAVDYEGYPEGSLPATEDLLSRVISLPTFIEESKGYSEQTAAAFRKVAAQYATLQTKQAKLRKFTTTTAAAAASKARGGLRRLLKR